MLADWRAQGSIKHHATINPRISGSALMRLFFHLNECGKLTPDTEGQELSTVEAGRMAAIRAAREVMCAEIVQGRLCLSCSIEITDPDGKAIMTVPFDDAVEIGR